MTATRDVDGSCPGYADGTHCRHWWDDDGPCCGCGDDTGAGESDGARREEDVLI